MTIKHLIISGGGANGLTFWGMIKECIKHNVINYNTIETITSTSVGSFLSVILALKYDIDVIDDYFIKRPWHETIPLGVYEYIESFNKCGIFDRSTIVTIMKPLFGGKHISLDITLKEFYEFSNIECNFLCTNATTLKPCLMSHDNFPNEKLLDIIYCCSSIPVIFQPIEIQNIHYIDGGINANYPIDFFIKKYENVNTDEILGIHNKLVLQTDFNYTNLMSYISSLIFTIIGNVITKPVETKIKYELCISPNMTDTFDFASILYDENVRKKYINNGSSLAENLITLYNGNNTHRNDASGCSIEKTPIDY